MNHPISIQWPLNFGPHVLLTTAHPIHKIGYLDHSNGLRVINQLSHFLNFRKLSPKIENFRYHTQERKRKLSYCAENKLRCHYKYVYRYTIQ